VKGSSSRTQGPAQSFGETANARTDAESCRTVRRPTHQPIIATLWFPKQSSRNPKRTYIDIMMCVLISFGPRVQHSNRNHIEIETILILRDEYHTPMKQFGVEA
jgi:hypothetical protein